MILFSHFLRTESTCIQHNLLLHNFSICSYSSIMYYGINIYSECSILNEALISQNSSKGVLESFQKWRYFVTWINLLGSIIGGNLYAS